MFRIYGQNLDVKEGKKLAMNATKYSRYGARKGIHTQMDRNIFNKNIEDEARAYGYDPKNPETGGVVTFRRTMPDGTAEPNPMPMEFGGRLHYPDANGVFRIVDDGFIQLQEKKYQEQEDYTNMILKKCLINNHLTAHILGVTEAQMVNELGFGKVVNGSPDDSLEKFNGTPEFLNTLDKTSHFFSAGVSKLRQFVKNHLPVIETATNQHVVKEAE